MGTYNYTIGQRKGLGIAGGEPKYVIALAAESREVVVGEASAAAVTGVRMGDITNHRSETSARVTVQVRSSGEGVPARTAADSDSVKVVFDEPVIGVAPGQTGVVYDGERVVLAGTIVSSE